LHVFVHSQDQVFISPTAEGGPPIACVPPLQEQVFISFVASEALAEASALKQAGRRGPSRVNSPLIRPCIRALLCMGWATERGRSPQGPHAHSTPHADSGALSPPGRHPASPARHTTAQALVARGHPVFLAARPPASAEAWAASVGKALNGCSLFVVVATRSYGARAPAQAEPSGVGLLNARGEHPWVWGCRNGGSPAAGGGLGVVVLGGGAGWRCWVVVLGGALKPLARATHARTVASATHRSVSQAARTAHPAYTAAPTHHPTQVGILGTWEELDFAVRTQKPCFVVQLCGGMAEVRPARRGAWDSSAAPPVSSATGGEATHGIVWGISRLIDAARTSPPPPALPGFPPWTPFPPIHPGPAPLPPTERTISLCLPTSPSSPPALPTPPGRVSR
jgi:hypothetical protein